MNPSEIYNELIKAGTRPVLTLYGTPAGAPRLELSGKVLANHCAKAANFLTEELLVDEGDGLSVDLPPHWRGLTWSLAAMLAGCVGGTDVIVSTEAGDGERIIVTLDALALSVPGLPPGAYDGHADVLGQPDVLLETDRSIAAEIEAGQSLFLVDPVPAQMLTGLVHALETGSRLVVCDGESEEIARREEGAEPQHSRNNG